MINLDDYKMTSASGAGLYCGTYKKYNEGSLFGMWIDLEACSDAEEFFDVCRELHKDEDDPEFMFQDYQGFPESMYHESMGDDAIERILEYVQMSDDEKELYDDYVEVFGDTDKSIDEMHDRCITKGYDSLDDFIDEQAEEMLRQYESMCEHEYTCKGATGIVDTLRKYFDYEAYRRDMRNEYYMGSNGYIFYSNY